MFIWEVFASVKPYGACRLPLELHPFRESLGGHFHVLKLPHWFRGSWAVMFLSGLSTVSREDLRCRRQAQFIHIYGFKHLFVCV